MCGLVGVVTKSNAVLNNEQRQRRGGIIRGLLVANEMRGGHSTGVGAVRGVDCRIIKELGGAREFVKRKKVNTLLRGKYDILIGHTRLATHGGVSQENAHPFREGSILGAHNGVIANYKKLDPTSSVDSQALLRSLDRNKNNFQKVFSDMRGTCALTWYDFNQPEMLYLVAHYNPLHLVLVPELSSIFWSSEQEGLEVVLASTIDFYNPIVCSHDQVYKINTNSLDITHEYVDFSKNYYAHWEEPSGGDGESLYGFKQTLAEHIAALKKKKAKKQARIVDIRDATDYYPAGAGEQEEWDIDRDSVEFANLVDDIYQQAFNGCAQCGIAVDYECWYDQEEERILCTRCKEQQEFPEELIRIDLLNDYYHAQEILGGVRDEKNQNTIEGQVVQNA